MKCPKCKGTIYSVSYKTKEGKKVNRITIPSLKYCVKCKKFLKVRIG